MSDKIDFVCPRCGSRGYIKDGATTVITAAAEVDPSPVYTQSEMNESNNQIASATIERCALVADSMAPEPDGAPDFIWTKIDSAKRNMALCIADAIRELKNQSTPIHDESGFSSGAGINKT